MVPADNSWISANSPIEFEKLHALGVVVYRWNACELGMRTLLASLKGPPFAEVWKDHSKSKRKPLLVAVESAIAASFHHEEAKEAARYAVKLYEVNAENKNQLLHFLASGSIAGIKLYNNKTSNFSEIFERQPIPSDLKDFRRVADEITACMRYITAMSNYLVEELYDPTRARLDIRSLPLKPAEPSKHWASP